MIFMPSCCGFFISMFTTYGTLFSIRGILTYNPFFLCTFLFPFLFHGVPCLFLFHGFFPGLFQYQVYKYIVVALFPSSASYPFYGFSLLFLRWFHRFYVSYWSLLRLWMVIHDGKLVTTTHTPHHSYPSTRFFFCIQHRTHHEALSSITLRTEHPSSAIFLGFSVSDRMYNYGF
ncbi:hypothetical protein BKA70DRAFT_7963 [Coprinopsis sp. MPI-PUGE-AT-0042]|nr:hypothetical protein BKA70DRAFT_7963 [Coprinopsis sp. MPI-PUGE-AT-0042]